MGETEQSKPVERMLTGYQWGDFGQYIGPYAFPRNLDKEDIHLPPNTTLVPPLRAAVDEEVAWNGKAWFVRRVQMDFMPDRDPMASSDLVPAAVVPITEGAEDGN